jgi:hypothetical protein
VDVDDFEELHYIAPTENLGSILAHGILSHQRASRLPHGSVAMPDIQARRRDVRVPTPDGSRPLHSYANLYFSARNPMLYKRRDRHGGLCVVGVRKDVLWLPGVVVTDCNASSDYVRFGAGPTGLRIVDKDMVFAESWTDSVPARYYRRKSAKCAEVLVPDLVPVRFLLGVYVSTAENAHKLRRMCELPSGFGVQVNGHLFFL